MIAGQVFWVKPGGRDMQGGENPTANPFYPVRYWWLKRIGCGVIALIVAVAVTDLLWWRMAHRRYQSVIDAAYARGEPVLPRDFEQREKVLDEQNVALPLMDAATEFGLRSLNPIRYDLSDVLNPRAEDVTAVKKLMTENQRAFALVRSAVLRPGAYWNIQLQTPVSNPWGDILDTHWNLAALLGISARINHNEGNDREALEIIRDILIISVAIQSGPSTLNEEQTVWQLTRIACQLLDNLATTDCKIVAAEGPERPFERSTTRSQFRGVIAMLLDDERFRAAQVKAWYGRRMEELDNARFVANGGTVYLQGRPWSGADTPWMLRPKIILESIPRAELLTRYATAFAQSNWQSARGIHPGGSYEFDVLNDYFRSVTMRHVTALRLAILLYRRDHQNTYPVKLTDLVPTYLPNLPSDPYASDGRPLAYRWAPLPVIYSVSHNGKDDGGTSPPILIGIEYYDGRWDEVAAVFPLDPSSQAVNHDPEKVTGDGHGGGDPEAQQP